MTVQQADFTGNLTRLYVDLSRFLSPANRQFYTSYPTARAEQDFLHSYTNAATWNLIHSTGVDDEPSPGGQNDGDVDPVPLAKVLGAASVQPVDPDAPL